MVAVPISLHFPFTLIFKGKSGAFSGLLALFYLAGSGVLIGLYYFSSSK